MLSGLRDASGVKGWFQGKELRGRFTVYHLDNARIHPPAPSRHLDLEVSGSGAYKERVTDLSHTTY